MSKIKIKIVQYFVGDNKEYLELAHEVEKLNKKYAEIHEYFYVFDYLDFNNVKEWCNKYYTKQIGAYGIQYIYDNLMKDDCDYLVFIDADAAISKPTIKIEDLIDSEHELFLSRNNNIWFQTTHLNNIKLELDKILNNKNKINKEFWSDILPIENKNNLYGSMEAMSSYYTFHNEGFYISKNTTKMKALFQDAIRFAYLLGDSVFYSPVSLMGQTISLCLNKMKYHSSFTFLPYYIQGLFVGDCYSKYDENKTFILHEYGDATTKQQKIDEVKALWKNKWWRIIK